MVLKRPTSHISVSSSETPRTSEVVKRPASAAASSDGPELETQNHLLRSGGGKVQKMTPQTLKPAGWARDIEDYYPFTGSHGIPPSSLSDVVFVSAVNLNQDCASFTVNKNVQHYNPVGSDSSPWSPVMVEAPRIDERTGAVNGWYTMNDAYMDPILYMVPFIGDLKDCKADTLIYVLREERGPCENKVTSVSEPLWQELGRSFRLGRREAQRGKGAGIWKSPSKQEQKSPQSPHGVLAVCASFELAKEIALLAMGVHLGRKPQADEMTLRDWARPPPDPNFLKKIEGSFLSSQERRSNPPKNWYQNRYLKQKVFRYELRSFALEITESRLCR